LKEFYGYFAETDYDADQFAKLSRARGGTGVGEGLGVVPAGGLSVSVGPGYASIAGYVYALEEDGGSAKIFDLSVAGSADRIDRIVLRLDLSSGAQRIVMAVKEGVPAPSPVPPEVENDGLIKEISLCRVRVRASASAIEASDLVDERLDTSVCGVPESAQLMVLLGRKMSADAGVALALEVAGKASTARYNAVLRANGWSGNGPYQQTVAVEGVLVTDDPLVDVNMSGAATGNAGSALTQAWTVVGRVDTGAGSITAHCYEDKPEVDIPVILKVVR
jgi:hypothetical protein